jgi:hypothetical protein
MQPGAFIRHYRINSHLGRGGMGDVFLAEDTKLKRSVAIKVLSGHRKPIFPFHFQFGRAEVFVSRRVTADELLTAQRLATELIGDRY